jgi:hypothetical protein
MLPTKGEGLTCPEARDDLKRLIEPLGPSTRVTLLAEVCEAGVRDDVIAHITEADAENRTALGELIDGGDLARNIPRPPARQRRHLDTKDEPARANCDRCEHRPRRACRHFRIALIEHVVLREDPVPASRLRTLRKLDEEAWVAALAPGW